MVNLKEKKPTIVKSFVGGECFKKVIVTEAKDFLNLIGSFGQVNGFVLIFCCYTIYGYN